FQMGRCMEKSGRRADAQKIYARVVDEFADQQEIATAAKVRLANWEQSFPGPRNLHFQEGKAGQAPPGWIVPALPQVADHWAEVRRTGCRSRKNCAVLLSPENAPGFGYLLQSFSARPYRGKTVRLRAWLKVEAVDSFDRGQMSLSVDRVKGRTGFYYDMN